MIKLRAIGRCLFFLQYVRSVAMSWFQSDVCVMKRLRKKKSIQTICVRVEVSSVESNETTAATVSCDLAPPPQRRRRRHPASPPRNLPFVTLPQVARSRQIYYSTTSTMKHTKLMTLWWKVFNFRFSWWMDYNVPEMTPMPTHSVTSGSSQFRNMKFHMQRFKHLYRKHHTV